VTPTQFALLAAVVAPWVAAIAIFALGETRERTRTAVGLAAAAIASGAAIGVGVAVASGTKSVVGVPLLGVRFALAADGLGVLFAVVAAMLWLVTTVYATGYMSHAQDRARFFGFFAICVGSAIGIAFAANLLTLFVFYEALTLATYPLVVHSGTPAALRGGRTYLFYALGGGTLLAVGVIWLHVLGGGADFASGPGLSTALVASHGPQLVAVFALLIAGFGVKAALFPAHGWLPAAMVAPAPVSALLHAVAVVKAGVFGIARVVLDVYGSETADSLGLLAPLAALAAFTIVFASVRALAQDDIKKRLAYSTIGQLSYIVLGLAIGTPLAAAAALAHLAHHAVLKITMFFTAGVLAEELGVYRVSEMDGVGKRMPRTMFAFSVAALGIVGVPPIAGFVSKWGLGLGGLQSGQHWYAVVLGLSSLLTAAYLLPMIGRAWFATPKAVWSDDRDPGHRAPHPEADRRMVWPLVLTAVAGLAFGVFAGLAWAPTSWAAFVTGAPRALAVPWRPSDMGLDVPGAFFLVLAVVVWSAAALSSWRFAKPRTRYRVFFVLSAAGSLGLAFARDPGSFYACFSVMALSAYGLIVHEDVESARVAGRVYLAFTLLGEALLLMGLLPGALGHGSPGESLAQSGFVAAGTTLLLLAFGIKIGALGMGGWMPGAYRAAAPGAGAALAGVISSAGVLGMLRFLPGGFADFGLWGAVLMGVGVSVTFYAAVVGCLQLHSRHVLAYSSMSQFGLMTVGIGAGLATAEVWPAAVAAVSIYLVHHGFAKAALFAGDDLAGFDVSRRRLAVLLALPALAVAGLPLTSGAIAKVALKSVAATAPGFWAHLLEISLPLAAVGTTLLMARFVVLAVFDGSVSREMAPTARRFAGLAFALLLVFVTLLLWVIDYAPVAVAAHKALTPEYLLALGWPVAVGLALAALAWGVRFRWPARVLGSVPPGDIWASVLDAANAGWDAYQSRLSAVVDRPRESSGAPGLLGRALAGARSLEERLLLWPVALGAVILLGAIVLMLAS
jgi:multicomponent Na+:H+ antiporter subunit D